MAACYTYFYFIILVYILIPLYLQYIKAQKSQQRRTQKLIQHLDIRSRCIARSICFAQKIVYYYVLHPRRECFD